MVLLEAFTLLASVGIGAKIAKDTITDEVVKYEVNGDLKREIKNSQSTNTNQKTKEN